MKRLAILTILLLSAAYSNATIWRMNNTSDTTADFSSFMDMNGNPSVVAGDTVHVEPSAQDYDNIYIDKKLVIIGPGFFIPQNDSTQTKPQTSKFAGNVDIDAEGVVIMGIEFGTQMSANLNIRKSDALISNCRFTYAEVEVADANLSNIVITGCYFDNSSSTCIRTYYNVTGCEISNSYFMGGIDVLDGWVVQQNIFGGAIRIYNSLVQNNIFINYQSPQVDGTGNGIYNNMSPDDQIPAGNGNQQYVDMTTVFIGYSVPTWTGSLDGFFELASGSPAIGAGIAGEDIGMFGGASPYKLSGIPNIPHIFYLSVPNNASANAGVKVVLKAKVD